MGGSNGLAHGGREVQSKSKKQNEAEHVDEHRQEDGDELDVDPSTKSMQGKMSKIDVGTIWTRLTRDLRCVRLNLSGASS